MTSGRRQASLSASVAGGSKRQACRHRRQVASDKQQAAPIAAATTAAAKALLVGEGPVPRESKWRPPLRPAMHSLIICVPASRRLPAKLTAEVNGATNIRSQKTPGCTSLMSRKGSRELGGRKTEVPNLQKQWLSSLTPAVVPLSSSNIPWLVSMAENYQGIILSQWWILSTVSCLNKLNPFHTDISGVINRESILLGHKICMHPGFNQKDGTESVKGDIGVVLLKYPIMRKEIPLSHTYTIFWRNCYNCLHRLCRVYQYEKHNNFGTSIRKLSVKLLDFSFCHHQHINMAKSNNLCIWSQPQGDCLLQQGSPVLCLFGIHWELVGLVREASITCYDPILVIKTAPYLTWMRLFIKASQKPMDPVLSLLCSFFSKAEHDLQDKFSIKNSSALLPFQGFSVQSQRRLETFPLNRQRRNPPLVFFGPKKRDSFLHSIQLYLQSRQLSLSRKFLVAQTWISPIVKRWEPSYIADSGNTQLTDAFESLVISGPQSTKRADILIPWKLDHIDAMKYQHETLTDLVILWDKLLDDVTAVHTLPLVYTLKSSIPYLSDIDGYLVSTEINAAYSHVKSSMFPNYSKFVARPWLEITQDLGPWTYSVPVKTERILWSQYTEENTRTQIYHVPETVNTDANPEKYNRHLLVSSLVNTIELQTHPILNEDGSWYPTVTQTFELPFQSVLDIYGSQESVEKAIRHWINPASMSTSSGDDHIRDLTLYKSSQIRSSSKMDRISLLSKHDTIILEHQMHTDGKTWLSIRPLTNAIKPLIHSKVDVNRPWNHPKSERINSETQIGKSLTQLNADIITLWLQTKIEKIRPWIQPYFKISSSKTQTEEGENKHTKAGTIKLWTKTKIENVKNPRNQHESETARSQNDHVKLGIQPDFKTLQSWTHSDIDIVRPSIRYDVESTQLETFIFKPWIQYKVNGVIPKTKPGVLSEVLVRVWLQSQTNTVKIWSQFKSQTNDVKSWDHIQMNTLKNMLETVFQRVHHLTPTEDAISRTWSQTKNVNVKLWFQTPVETVSQWTVIQTEYNLIQPETEVVSPWIQPVMDKLNWIQHKGYSVWSSNKLVRENIGLWSQSEVEVLRPWFHTDINIVQTWMKNKSSILTGGTQTESPEENFWRQSETDKTIQWTEYETLIVNYWKDVLSGIVTPWINTELGELKSQIQSNSEKVPVWKHAESPILKVLTLSETGTFKTWPQYETFREWVVNNLPALHQWTKTVDAEEQLWSEDELRALNTLTGSKTDNVKSWNKGKLPAIILQTHPMSHKIVPWTWAIDKIVKPWPETIVPTVTKLQRGDSPFINLWEKTLTDKITLSLPKDEYPAGNICSLPLYMSPWAQNQPINIRAKPVAKIITPQWLLDKYQTMNLWPVPLAHSHIPPWPQPVSTIENLWPVTLSDTIILPWRQAKYSLVIKGTQPVSEVIPPLWTQVESLPEYLWIKSVSNILRPLWPQDKISTGNSWPETSFDTITSPLPLDESPPEKLWTLLVSNAVTLQLPQLETSRINLWTLLISDISIPIWPQIKHKPENIWTLSSPDRVITLWPQVEYPPVNEWTLFISDEISHWLQDESSPVNLFKTYVSDRTIPLWSQDKLSPGYLWPWTFSKTVTTSEFQDKLPIVNLWTQLVSETIIPPQLQVDYTPANVWILPLSDTIMTPWSQAEYLPVNQWTFFISDEIISHWLQDESSPVNLFKTYVSYRTTLLWPQDESPLRYLWPWTFSTTVTTSEFQDELTTVNQWTQLVSDTIISPLPQVNYIPENVWTLSLPNATRSTWFQAEYAPSNQWTKFISDELRPYWLEDESSPVNLFKMSVSDTVSSLWPLNESPLGYWPWTFTKTIIKSKFQDDSPTINLWKQLVSTIVPPTSQVQYPLATVLPLPLLDTILPPWPRFEYPIVSLWTLQASDTIMPSWPKTEFSPGTVLTLSLSNTITPLWSQAEFPAETSWPNTLSEIFTASKPQIEKSQANELTLLVSDTIIPSWPQTKSLAGNLWTLSMADEITPHWPQTEYPPFNLWAMLPFDTVTHPGFQNESSSLILWTMPVSDTIAQHRSQAQSLHINLRTLSLSYTMTASWPQAEFPGGILWPQTLSDTMEISKAQAESRANLRTLLVSDTIILPWPKVSGDSPINLRTLPVSDKTTSLWLHTEYPQVSLRTLLVFKTVTPLWPQTESPARNLWSQILSKKVSATWIEAKSPPINPSPVPVSIAIITPRPQAEISAGTIWAQLVSDTVISLWPQAESMVEYAWEQPVSDMLISLWTQAESTVVYLWPMPLNDTITPLWSQGESPTLKLWVNHVSDAVILPWFQAKSTAVNLQPQLLSDTILPWSHNESPLVNLWTQAVTDTIISPWIENESSVSNLLESETDTVTLQWPHIESLPVNVQSETMYIATPLWLQGEYPAVHPWTHFLSDRIISAWLRAESSIISLWILTISATDTPKWIQGKVPTGNFWPKSFSDRATPLWLQTETPLVNLWPGLVSHMITLSWPLADFLAIHTSTLSISETITPPWSQNESPLENLWTLPMSNILKPPWLQAEYSTASPKLPLTSEPNRSSRIQAENSVSIPLTEFTAEIFRPWTQSKFLTVEPGFQTFSDVLTLWFQAESPSVRHWTQAISDAFALWNQATSPVIYLWTRYEIDTFKKWSNSQFPRVKLPTPPVSDILSKAKTEASIPWTKLETDIVSHLTQTNTEVINSKIQDLENRVLRLSHVFSLKPRTQFESDTVRTWIQAQSPTLIPWTQTEKDTITSLTQALRPALNVLTVFVTGTDMLWNIIEVIRLKDREKLTTELGLQWTQNKSTAMNAFILPMLNTVTLFTQAVSSVENHWTQLEAHKVTPQTYVKSLKKYALTESDSETVTSWNPDEFSEVKTLSEADTLTLWQQTVSKTVILWIDTIAKTGKLWTHSQSSALNPWTQFVANKTTTWIQTEPPARNHWVPPIFNNITLRTQAKSPLVNTWIQEETIDPLIALESPTASVHTEFETLAPTPWSKSRSSRITPWVYTENHLTTKRVILCTRSESTKFNSFLQKGNKVIACSQTEFSRINPQKRAKVPKVIPWTQAESPSISPWTGATKSKSIPWTQTEYLQVDSWEDATVSKVVPWIQTEYFPTKPWIEAIDSEVITWSEAKFPTVGPWIQPMGSTVIFSAKGIYSMVNTWAQTSSTTLGTHSESEAVNTHIQPIFETLIPLSQDESRIVNSRVQSLAEKVTTWTQIETLAVKAWSEATVSKITTWKKRESLSGKSYTQIENDTGIFSRMLTQGATKPQRSTEINAFRILMQFQTDATQHLNNESLLGTHPEIEKVKTWYLGPEFGTLSYWIVQPESFVSKDGFKIQTESIKPWKQSDIEMLGNFTSLRSNNIESLVQPQNIIVISQIQKKTSTVSPWAQPKMNANRTLTQDESPVVRLWTQTVPNIVTLLSESAMQTAKHLAMLDINNVITLFQTQNDIIKRRTQIDSQIVTSWVQPEMQVAHPWNEPKIDIVRPWSQLDGYADQPWTHTEENTVGLQTYSETDKIQFQTQPESQAVRIWPEADKPTLWSLTRYDAIRPLSQIKFQILHSGEVGITKLWTQNEVATFSPWTSSDTPEILPWIQPNRVISYLFQYQKDSFRTQNQAESKAVQTWTETTLIKVDTTKPWIQSNTTKPWIQTDSSKMSSWIQTDVGIVRSWTQKRAASHDAGTYPEIQAFTPWDKLQDDTVRSLFNIQMNKERSLTYLESQILTQPEVGTKHSWFRPKTEAVKSWTQSETFIVKYRSQFVYEIVKPLSSLGRRTLKSWIQSETQPDISSFSITNTDKVSTWVQSETKILIPGTYYKADVIDSFTVSDVESGEETLLKSHFGIWPKIVPFLPVETIPSLDKGENISLSTIATIENQDKNNSLQPSHTTNTVLLTLLSGWILGRFGYQSGGSNVQITQAIGNNTQITQASGNNTQNTKASGNNTQNTQASGNNTQNTQASGSNTQITQANVSNTQITQANISNTQITQANVSNTQITQRNGSNTQITQTNGSNTQISHTNGSNTQISQTNNTQIIQTNGNNTHISQTNGSNTQISQTNGSNTQISQTNRSNTHISQTNGSNTQISQTNGSNTQIIQTTGSSTQISQTIRSNIQITQITGSLDIQVASTSSLSSDFISCSDPSSCTLSPSCSFFTTCILPSSCISPFCSISFFVTSSLPLPSIISDSLRQELSFSKSTEEITQNFSSLHATPATFLTKSPLVPISQFESPTKTQPGQLPLSHSKFNVSLAECRLGVIWRDDLQALWLFKTAIVSHEITECGLRHGLVPQCPNCWEAEIGEFPWMVSVQLSLSHFCAGSILNKQWILTSARCAHFIKNAEALALVQVGLIDLQDPGQAQTIGIHHAMPYLGPKGPLGPGLIFLKEPLNFQPMALPICLEESLEQERNIQLYDCWLPSWSLMRGSPGILQKRHLSIRKVSTCAQFWPKLNEFTFCVEAKKAMGEAGCKGDLGAPLVCHLQQKNTWVQVGILSRFDERCTKPYVFSQVSPFIFWLQGVTRPSFAPWSQQGPMTTSASIAISISTTRNGSALTSTTASVQPNFVSLPQPQTLADRISLRYTMPWQAIIINCGNQICSGSIISNSWVLTAAHCVRNMNPEDTVVILGLRYPGAPLRVLKVSNILLHERFRLVSGIARNDIALLLLQGTPTSIQTLAPLGHVKNLNSTECWLSGPRILKPGETDEHPEILQMHMMQASNCVSLYRDLGSSIVCFYTRSKNAETNADPVSPGSAVMCRPISGGKWKQIGLTSLKSLATIVSPHLSWILTTSAKSGHPLNQEIIPLVELPKSSCPLKQTNILLPFLIMIIVLQRFLEFRD